MESPVAFCSGGSLYGCFIAGFFVVNNQTNIENDQAELFIDNGEFPFKFSEKLHFAYKNNDKRLIKKIVKKANTKNKKFM